MLRLISKPRVCPACKKKKLVNTYEDLYPDRIEKGYTCMFCYCKFEEEIR
jgi:hypothetical protein